MLTIGLIGGSGLLKTNLKQLKDLTEEFLDTAHGRVFLRTGTIAEGVKLVFVQRHDAKPSRVYTQPSDINYQAIALALKAKAADVVVGICSVGSLKASIGVGALMVPDDFYCPDDLRRVYTDFRAHLMPGYDEKLRGAILAIVRGVGFHPDPHGTYVNSHGPRFETKAEIRMMASAGEIVGMTGAHEVAACNEVGLPYACLCMIDNYANGIGAHLSLEAFHEAQAANRGTVEKCVAALLEELPLAWAIANATTPAGEKAAPAADAHAAPAATGGAGTSAGAAAAAAAPATATATTTAAAAAPAAVSDSAAAGATGGAASMPATPVPPTPVAGSPHGPMPVDTLIHARWVVPVASGRESQVLDHHSVAILDGMIIDVLPTARAGDRYTAAKVVTLDADHALIPGLINAHTHMSMNMMRGVADDLPLDKWLTEEIWPTEARLVSSDFCRAGARAAIAELIRSGVTCVNDMYFFPGATAEVAHAAGYRAVLGMTLMEFPTSYASAAPDYFEKGLALKAHWDAKQKEEAASTVGGTGVPRPSRVRWSIAPHAPYTVSEPSFERVKAVSAEMGIPIHLHLHETAGEVHYSKTGEAGSTRHLSEAKCSPVENLARLGVLNERLVAVHMTQLTDAEIDLVADAKTSVVHCPNSNLKLASGFCPVSKLLDAGINVAIGTDSASSNNSLDFFQEMKLAAVLAKGVSSDATAVPAWQALRMATLNGAIALGLGDLVGSIEAGKRADLVAVNLGEIDQLPVFNIISHLVYACSRSNVTDVWVDGVPLLSARRLVTLDEEAVRTEILEWAAKARPGLTAHDKHERLARRDTKHVHTAATHGAEEAGKVHTAGSH